MVPLVIVKNVKVVEPVTVIEYLPDATTPVETSRKTLFPVARPCAELVVTVTVENDREYVALIPGSRSMTLSVIRSSFNKPTCSGSSRSLTRVVLHLGSVNAADK